MEEHLQKDNREEFIDFILPRPLWLKVRKPVITAFILFNFYLVFLVFMRDTLLAEKLLHPFDRYVIFFGIHQAFNVFAPSPRQNNNHVVSSITYKDGSTQVQSLTRLERVPLIRKLFLERHRKFLSDNVTSERFPFLYDDIARYIARHNNSLPDNPPVIVSLYSYSCAIPPLENGLDAGLLKEQLKNLEAGKAPLSAEGDKSGAVSKAVSEKRSRSIPSYNRFDNQFNPDRSELRILTVYRVNPEDLE